MGKPKNVLPSSNIKSFISVLGMGLFSLLKSNLSHEIATSS